jgi:large subunit ribosomal protein L28
MSKICVVTGKKVMSGNNVSHANNKTRRKYNVNLQNVSLMSESLSRSIPLRLSTKGLKTIEFHGGLDAFLVKKSPSKLSLELRSLRKIIVARLAKDKATA